VYTSVKFCQFVANFCPHIFTNFGGVISIFRKMALIFLGVLTVSTVSSFEFRDLVSSCTQYGICLRGTVLTVAHRTQTLSVGGVSGQPHSKDGCATTPALNYWPPSIRCAWPDGLELFARRPSQTAGFRLNSNRAWNVGCFLDTSVRSALRQSRCINWRIPYHTVQGHIALTSSPMMSDPDSCNLSPLD